MTGLYPPRTGWTTHNISNRECLDPSFGTFVRRLRKAGYKTAVAGKWQLCPFEETFDHPAQFGFDKWIISEGGPHWGAKTWVNGARARKLERKDIYIADEHTNFAIRFIRRNAAKPFFLYFPTKLPHSHWSKTPDNLNKKWPNKDPRYFPGMVKYADKMVGQIRRALKKEGIRKRTIIILLTDNGSKGRFVEGKGKGTSRESGINVPLIIKWPGTTEPGAIRDDLADVTDLYPTILEMAGQAAEGNRDGFSLVPALTGNGGTTGRKWIYAQRKDVFAIRQGDWKLRENEQLFDLLNDPFEKTPILPNRKNETDLAAQRRRELESILTQEGLGPE